MYCDEYICACVCLSVRISAEQQAPFLPFFVHVAYVTSFFYNGPYSAMNFATKDRFRLNLLIYRKVGQNSISYY